MLMKTTIYVTFVLCIYFKLLIDNKSGIIIFVQLLGFFRVWQLFTCETNIASRVKKKYFSH